MRGTKLIGAVLSGRQNHPNDQKYFSRKLERGRDFHENLSLATNDWSCAKTYVTVSRIVDSHEPV